MLTFKSFIAEAGLLQRIRSLGSDREHAAVRYTNPRKDSPIIRGDRDSVDMDSIHNRTLEHPDHIGVHSHPVDGALSKGDANYLFARPKLKTLHAITPSGSLYSAKVTPKGRALADHPADPIQKGINDAAFSIVRNVFDKGKYGENEKLHLQGHIIHQALHNLGLIRYRASMVGKDRIITAKHKKLISDETIHAARAISYHINRAK